MCLKTSIQFKCIENLYLPSLKIAHVAFGSQESERINLAQIEVSALSMLSFFFKYG